MSDGSSTDLYRRTGAVARRAAPLYLGGIAAFLVLASIAQLAIGEFDGVRTVIEGGVAILIMTLPVYVVGIGVIQASLEGPQ